MNSRNALYFPFLAPRDEAWLKQAALFWDHLLRIVPVDGYFAEEPPLTQRELTDTTDFFMDIAVLATDKLGLYGWKAAANAINRILVLLVRDAMARPDSPFRFLVKSNEAFEPYFTWGRWDGAKTLPSWRAEMTRLGLIRLDEDGYQRFDRRAGAIYMALLARHIARKYNMAIVTDDAYHARLLEFIEFEQPLIEDLDENSSLHPDSRLFPWLAELNAEYAREIKARPTSFRSSAFALCQFTFQSLNITDLDSVPMQKIIKFRESYADERHRYFDVVTALAEAIDRCHTPEEAKDRLLRAGSDIKDALKDIQASLRGLRIDSVLSWSSISLSLPIAKAISAVVPVSEPLIIGASAAIGVAAALRRGQKARLELARSSPWIYVVRAEKEFRTEAGLFSSWG